MRRSHIVLRLKFQEINHARLTNECASRSPPPPPPLNQYPSTPSNHPSPLLPPRQTEDPTTPPPYSEERADPNADVTDHVTGRVTLGWRCGESAEERRGTADLRGVTWTESMLDHLRMCPVTWGELAGMGRLVGCRD